ncbi:MAG: hypothetical protein F6J93_07795 [Oscillatoria sp. SIO1A7]|nr:hypothetical protein [Oscillatoria sp. SIO1A7]
MPSKGVGGNGTASEFGDLTGMTRQEIDEFFKKLDAKVKITSGGYVEYKFPDRSKVIIRPDGEVVRTPAPIYASDGSRINRGLRLDREGRLMETRDKLGNPIPDTHNTGERVRD